MSDVRFFCVIIVLFINYLFGANITQLHKRVAEIKRLSKKMYGEVNEDNTVFNHNLEEYLLYPRGDKDKLAILSNLWRDYYDCLVRSAEALTTHRQVPSVILMMYVGAVARLSCPLCIAPGELTLLEWMFSESTTYMTFSPLKENERTVREVANLTIHHVRPSDAGVYRCQIGDSRSLHILEVVDTEEDYSVVKPHTSGGPYPTPPRRLNSGVTLFTRWSPWSECSVCGKVGRRHRYGLCYVKMHAHNSTMSKNLSQGAVNTSNDDIFHQKIFLFEGNFPVFPDGIPCRSNYLPKRISRMHGVRERRSEIMIGMCKVPCKVSLYEALSPDGTVVEKANNSAGVYSLRQVLPKQPSTTHRDIIFAYYGEQISLQCPGTTLQDVPIVWRAGTKLMVPRETDQISGGRVYFNSRGQLIFNKVLFRDADIYSCWQRGRRAGALRLAVRPWRWPSHSPREYAHDDSYIH